MIQALELQKRWDLSLEEAVLKLRENISVTTPNQSGHHEIRVQSSDPELAPLIAEKLAAASVTLRNQQEETRRGYQLQALAAEIEDQLQKVAAKKTILAQFASSNSEPSEIEKARLDYDRANSLLNELEKTHVAERAELKSQLISARVVAAGHRPIIVSPHLTFSLLLGIFLGGLGGALWSYLNSSKL
ncbi:hypothetical protein AAFN60_15260 [Roseibacillus persicicus]|uniref:hypothetical protein n=1 Tax=Roseibacillus persicicus TaxID=454148 RepID=UPI00398B3588